MGLDLRFEIIKGLLKESMPSYTFTDTADCAFYESDYDTWSLEYINDGVFGQGILYHNGQIMANIGIYDNLIIFTCNRGEIDKLNADLHNNTYQSIRSIFNHLLRCENMPAGS